MDLGPSLEMRLFSTWMFLRHLWMWHSKNVTPTLARISSPNIVRESECNQHLCARHSIIIFKNTAKTKSPFVDQMLWVEVGGPHLNEVAVNIISNALRPLFASVLEWRAMFNIFCPLWSVRYWFCVPPVVYVRPVEPPRPWLTRVLCMFYHEHIMCGVVCWAEDAVPILEIIWPMSKAVRDKSVYQQCHSAFPGGDFTRPVPLVLWTPELLRYCVSWFMAHGFESLVHD